jgi:hypothetical protein
MITKVTITGADDSIVPKSLVDLSGKYAFVEWGILVSRKHFGIYRFPGMDWLKELCKLWIRNDMKLSCHLCGEYVRDLAKGGKQAINELGYMWDMFERVQINFHTIPHEFSPKLFDILMSYPEKEFIFQYDAVNDHIVEKAKDSGVDNCSILFDTSGGKGILPEAWPAPPEWINCGYAGGISPDNIKTQMILIEDTVGRTKTWIDMETHVRSDNDARFDLGKVEQCLKIADEFIPSEYKNIYYE